MGPSESSRTFFARGVKGGDLVGAAVDSSTDPVSDLVQPDVQE